MNNDKKSSKTLNIALWVAQAILAAFFIMAGVSHLMMPIEKLSSMALWTKDVSPGLVRLIGFFELLGGIGLLLPAILRVKPQLTAWAAIGVGLIMLAAIPFHFSRGEGAMTGMHFIIVAVAIFIAWGRFKKAPIAAK